MPQAPEGPRKKKVVKKKSVGDAISGAAKKPVNFGPKVVKPKVAGRKIGPYPVPKKALKKGNPRTVNDPRGRPLKHAGGAEEAIKKAGYAPLSPLGKKTTAPVLKALDVSARPLYAVMNAKKQELINQGIGDPAKKGSVVHAAKRGIQGKDKTVGSDVLKQAGVKNKTVRAVAGFVGDSVVTAGYPGLRGGSLAGNAVENAALREGERALKKAAKQGLKPAAQQNFKRMAERQAEKGRGAKKPLSKRVHYKDKTGKPLKPEKPRGAWVGVGYGREGQLRLKKRTDRSLMGDPKPRSKRLTKASNAVRGVVHNVRPTVRANALDDPRDAQKVLAVRAEERATSNTAYDRAIHTQESIQRGLKREDYAKVVDAIERKTIRGLPEDLREPAVALRSSFRHQRRVRRQAGQPYAVGGKTPARRVTVAELPAVRSAAAKAGKTPSGKRVVREANGKHFLASKNSAARRKEWDVLPDDAQVWVFHYTDKETAERFAKEGVRLKDKPMTLPRRRAEAGQPAVFQPGAGLGHGLSVGVTPASLDGYGREGVALLVRKGDVAPSPEQVNLGAKTSGDAVSVNDAMLVHDVSAKDVVRIPATGRVADHAAISRRIERASPSAGGRGRDVTAYLKKVEDAAAKHPGRGPKPSKMGYVPHMRESDIRAGVVNKDEVIFGTRKGPAGTNTTKKREVKKPISAQNPDLPDAKKYSTDLSVVAPNALIQTGRVKAKADVANGFSEVGDPVKVALAKTKKGTLKRRLVIPAVPENKVLVHIGAPSRKAGGGGPRVQAIDADGAKALASGKGFSGAFKGGQFRVVDKNAVRTLKESGYDYKQLRYDKVLSTWKSVATATPTFQMRNLVGDTERAFTQIPRRKMPRLMAEAPRISRFMRSQQFRVAGPAVKRKGGLQSGDMIDLGKSGKVSVDDFVKELKDQHIISAGIRGQDIRASGTMGRDISFGEGVGKTARVHRAVKDTMSAEYGNLPTRRVGEALQTRENLPYIMVYKHFREEGLSPRQARAKTMDRMIDYGELTPFEAGTARRIAPFYTFSARVVPAYAKAFVKDPGKIANYEALRQEVGNFFGVDASDIEKEATFVQRGAGIPVKWKGETFYVSYGLPLAQGLNELPFGGVNGEYAKELFRYGISILAPWWKAPIEVLPVAQGGTGWNFFFESPLQSKTSPYVPAPVIPGVDLKEESALAKALGIVEYTNRDGVRQMGWDGWKSYLWNIPMTGTPGFAFRIGQASNQRHQSQAQSALSFASGAKIDRSDPLSAAISNTFEYIDGLETARGRADKRYGKESAQYQVLNKKITAAKRFLYKLSQQRGDKNPYGTPPKKGRVKKVNPGGDPLGLNSSGASDSDPLGLSSGTSSDSDPLGLN